MRNNGKYMKNRITLLNMLSNFLLQIFTIISGFIIPRIILVYFGSEVNGLVSSLTQFLSYISLVEGGIGAVVLANLYKPLVENDRVGLNRVMSTANHFYKSIGKIFIGYSIFLSIIYPIIFRSNFSFGYICTLTLILSIGTTVQYLFAINIKTLLNADKKIYIVSFSQIVVVIVNIFLVVISVKVYPSIHLLKIITSFVYALQPIFYNYYIKKNYSIDWTMPVDNKLIKERWNGFAINTAAFIHNCTDVAVLTIFTNLSTVSVYAVYSLVTNGIKQLVTSLLNGINPTIGLAYAKGDLEDLKKKMDLYEFFTLVFTCFSYTMTALLIAPFAMIYTHGVTDTNYYQPVFGILLVLSEALYIVKFPHLNLAYAANRFKDITIPAYIEAGLNIVISALLVYKRGLVGAAVGTIVAMIYRMIFHVYYTRKIVVGWKQWIFYKKFLTFLGGSIATFVFCVTFFPIKQISVMNWIIHALLYGIVTIVMILVIIMLMFRSELKFCCQYLKRK